MSGWSPGGSSGGTGTVTSVAAADGPFTFVAFDPGS